MIPYFEYIIYIIFILFGLIVGISISNKVKINIKLTDDPITNAAYSIVVAFSGIMILLIGFNSIFLVAKIELPYFLETSAIDILKAIGPVYLGAITVFLSRREKREEKEKEISEKLASPVFLEIEKIQDDLLGEHPSIYPTTKNYFEKWDGIKGTRYEIESLNINDSIDDFYENVKNYLASLGKIGNNITYRMNCSFNGIVLSNKDIDYDIDVDSNDAFEVKYWSSIEWKKLPLIKHIILGINPIEWAKRQDPNLTDDRIKIKILSIYEPGRPLSEDEVEFEYIKIKKEFDDFINYMEEIMSKPDYIEGIRKLRENLLFESNKILDSLGDYI
jgi:hypothetical protein